MLEEDLKAIYNLTEVLMGDVTMIDSRLRESPSSTDRRSYVRAIFAVLEGTTWGVKQVYLHTMKGLCRPEEVQFLKEEDSRLSETGTIELQKAKISLLPNIR